MTRTVAHDTFVIERQYAASPARVFTAFADPAAKAHWFGDPGTPTSTPHELDFRVGGRESMRAGAPGDGPSFTYDALYQDIVTNQRIVYSYEMTMNGNRISVSVATVELIGEGTGTHLILTEQGAFLDGLDTGAIRKQGTEELLDALGRYVDAASPS
ncbi:SRPBCC family protein [Jatrophihabitans sp. DSM 45814]